MFFCDFSASLKEKNMKLRKSKIQMIIVIDNIYLVLMHVYSLNKHFVGIYFDVSSEMFILVNENDKCPYREDTSDWRFLLYKINDFLKEMSVIYSIKSN